MSQLNIDEFEIRVEFERGVGDPTRIFKSMTELIQSTQRLNQHLALSIGVEIQTSLVLQDVEAASLKAILRTILTNISDDTLRTGEPKKIIGEFLVLGKHKILDWCNERNVITDRSEVTQLQGEILELAEATQINAIPAYTPIHIEMLLEDIKSIRQATSELGLNDLATFTSYNRTSIYNSKLEISELAIRDLLTERTSVTENVRILKVKKPDYLENSKWEFKLLEHGIGAKILDKGWLGKFQSTVVRLNSGDSLEVLLRQVTSFGYDRKPIHTDYEVLKVHNILPGDSRKQADLI